MRCSKAMTSSNAARYTEPVGGGDPRTRGDPPDRPRDANSSPGTRARFRRFNYDVSIDIRYVCEPRASPTHIAHATRCSYPRRDPYASDASTQRTPQE
jgi:hypothetical protein